MSGGNCPETPRQKMIGMMYMMLTAMLALNVSGDLLNAYDLVDKTIKSTNRNTEAKLKGSYLQFEQANAQNPNKVGETYQNALKIREAADEMYNHIKDIKALLVTTADGPEATEDSYLSLSNQDIGAQIMIVENGGARGEELREKLIKYREFLQGLLKDNPRAERLTKALDQMILIKDSTYEDGITVPWQDAQFEHLPLAASMCLLSNMQACVRNAEADMINFLYGQIDAASFKFNKIEPLIIAKSNYVLQGSNYEADIMLAAYDDAMEPTVLVSGNKLEVEAGRGKYNVPATAVGNKSYEAELHIPDPLTGEQLTWNVKGEYEVGAPNCVISPIKMNAMYRGLENPISISASGVAPSDLKISATGCKLVKQGDNYMATPGPEAKAVISVTADVNGKTIKFPSSEFRIFKVPDPTPELKGSKDGIIKKAYLKNPTIVATLKDFVFDTRFDITEFTVTAKQGGFDVMKKATGSVFTQEQKELLGKLGSGQKFYIEGIKARGPDGTIRNLGTLALKVD